MDLALRCEREAQSEKPERHDSALRQSASTFESRPNAPAINPGPVQQACLRPFRSPLGPKPHAEEVGELQVQRRRTQMARLCFGVPMSMCLSRAQSLSLARTRATFLISLIACGRQAHFPCLETSPFEQVCEFPVIIFKRTYRQPSAKVGVKVSLHWDQGGNVGKHATGRGCNCRLF